MTPRPLAPVITGCGVVSPLGPGVSAFRDGLLAGRVAFSPIRRFAADGLDPSIVAEVDATTTPDRGGAFLAQAAAEAMQEASLPAGLDPTRVGVSLGTTLGGMLLFEAWEGGSPGGFSRDDLGHIPYFGPAVGLARAIGARGPVATTQLACASGTHALGLAREWIEAGMADVVLAGGTDHLCRFVVAGFNCLRATAEVARPFDRARSGLVLGEGAAVLIVESAAHAARRRGPVLARLLGAGAAGDGVHMTAPDREGAGAERAIRAALAEAGVAPSDVQFVSAHGTATVFNDAMEARCLTRVFGPRAVPVNSIKGAIGHTLGAAGALEAVLCVDVIRSGAIPPTAGLREIDPACAGIDVVVDAPRRGRVDVALSTSSGFAGANAAVVVGAP